MSDDVNTAPLFRSTREAAGQQAATKAGVWRANILARLGERPSALFEVAAHFGVPDHAISGRFTELSRDGYIETTGERRSTASGASAEVYQLRRQDRGDEPDWATLLGYPFQINIGGELFDRQKMATFDLTAGVLYARNTDTGALRQTIRVAFVECPSCGRPLFDQARDERGRKLRCGRCGLQARAIFLHESGRAAMLALVMETL